MTNTTNTIPRRLWLLWYQGQSEAPLVVRRCIASWVQQHPHWEVTILDRNNLSDFVSLGIPEAALAKLSLSHRSDLIRLHLLAQYGGVWADATTYCMCPLDTWLDACTTSGSFAFHQLAPDRLFASWFLAAEPHCPLVVTLQEYLTCFWTRNCYRVDTPLKKRIIRQLR